MNEEDGGGVYSFPSNTAEGPRAPAVKLTPAHHSSLARVRAAPLSSHTARAGQDLACTTMMIIVIYCSFYQYQAREDERTNNGPKVIALLLCNCNGACVSL